MSDEFLRTLERRYLVQGTVEALNALRAGRERAGQLVLMDGKLIQPDQYELLEDIAGQLGRTVNNTIFSITTDNTLILDLLLGSDQSPKNDNPTLELVIPSGLDAMKSFTYICDSLTTITIERCHSLKYINLSRQKLTRVTIAPGNPIETLYLRQNNIVTLEIPRDVPLCKFEARDNPLRQVILPRNEYQQLEVPLNCNVAFH